AFMGSPIFYDGIGYAATAYDIQAFDGATCRRLWRHPYTPTGRDPVPTTRGLTLYDGKLFRGSTDGHLLAIDARTGKLFWTFNSIPTGKEPGAETWKKGAEAGGGGTWSTITVDPAEGALYVPIGN